MNYELAKRLKDAGWKESCLKNGMPYYGDTPLDLGILPPLSELIEACGEERFSMNWDGHNPHYASKEQGHSSNVIAEGSSFEEAVSNLWLALHEKK